MSPGLEDTGLPQGMFVAGVSFCLAYVAAKRRWRRAPIALVVIGLFAGGSITTRLVTNPARRARSAKAQADIRRLADAIRDFTAHCGRLPVGGAEGTTTCTATTTAASGPVAVPSVLLLRQTNARNEVRGPFIQAIPTLPHGWKGVGNSYAYYTSGTGTFTVCATGDDSRANSNGGTTCP